MLVRYDDRILRAQLDKAAATLGQAELDHQRNRQLKAKGFVSEDAVSRAATALEIARAEVRLLRARVQHMTLTAPFDGVVARAPGRTGQRHAAAHAPADRDRSVAAGDRRQRLRAGACRI